MKLIISLKPQEIKKKWIEKTNFLIVHKHFFWSNAQNNQKNNGKEHLGIFFNRCDRCAPPPLPQYPEWTQHPYPRSHLIAPTGDRGHAMVTDRRTTCTAHGPCGGLLWQRVQPSMGANVFVCDASQRSRLFWDVGDIFSLCGYMYQLFLLSLSSFVIHWMF